MSDVKNWLRMNTFEETERQACDRCVQRNLIANAQAEQDTGQNRNIVTQYHTLGTPGIFIFDSCIGIPIIKLADGSSFGNSSYFRVSVYTVIPMQLNAEKKPATQANPNDQPRTLISQRGIHVRSSPIITANTTTDIDIQAAVKTNDNIQYLKYSESVSYQNSTSKDC